MAEVVEAAETRLLGAGCCCFLRRYMPPGPLPESKLLQRTVSYQTLEPYQPTTQHAQISVALNCCAEHDGSTLKAFQTALQGLTSPHPRGAFGSAEITLSSE